jgi:hypothetical protein
MAEITDKPDLSMVDIEKSIQQVLDTQEDDDDFLNSNMFFNRMNSKTKNKGKNRDGLKHSKKTREIFECDDDSMGCDTDEYTPYVNREMILENIDSSQACQSEPADSKMYSGVISEIELPVQIEADTVKTQSVRDYDEFVEKIRTLTSNFKGEHDLSNITQALKLKGIDINTPIIKLEFGNDESCESHEFDKLLNLFGNVVE